MIDADPATLPLEDGAHLAYHKCEGFGPLIVFMGGFRSDMTGTKARALEDHARRRGQGFVRFDYRGHGASTGRFEDLAIGDWLADTLAVIDRLTTGPVILVGSSMGGWLAVLAALARPARVAGLVTIAAAPDFTRRLVKERLTPEARAAIERDGVWYRDSAYGDGPYPITRRLIEEGESHCLLDGPVAVAVPVRLFHGLADDDVPWRLSLELAEAMTGTEAALTLIKHGDHRLSAPAHLSLYAEALDSLSASRMAASPLR